MIQEHTRTSAKLRFGVILGILASLILVAGGLVCWFVNPFRVPDKLDVLDRTRLGDGNELILAQRYNCSLGEPSTITVYQQVRSNLWIAYYVDHEARYWRSGRLAAKDKQGTRFVVFRGNEAIAEIDCGEYKSAPSWNTRLVRKASLLDQSPLENPNRRPQSLGHFQP